MYKAALKEQLTVFENSPLNLSATKLFELNTTPNLAIINEREQCWWELAVKWICKHYGEVILNETGVILTRHQAFHLILSYHRRVRVRVQSDIQIIHPCYYVRIKIQLIKKPPQAVVRVTIIYKN